MNFQWCGSPTTNFVTSRENVRNRLYCIFNVFAMFLKLIWILSLNREHNCLLLTRYHKCAKPGSTCWIGTPRVWHLPWAEIGYTSSLGRFTKLWMLSYGIRFLGPHRKQTKCALFFDENLIMEVFPLMLRTDVNKGNSSISVLMNCEHRTVTLLRKSHRSKSSYIILRINVFS